MSTNYFGPFLLTEVLVDYLKKQFSKDKVRINMICPITRLIDRTYDNSVKHRINVLKKFNPSILLIIIKSIEISTLQILILKADKLNIMALLLISNQKLR